MHTRTTTSNVNICSKCSMRYHTLLTYSKEMVGLLYGLRTLCRRTTEGSRQSELLVTSIQRFFKLLKTYTTVTFCCLVVYLMSPVKMHFVDKKLVALMPLDVLFCDQSTTFGYVMTTFVQVTMGLHLLLISFATTLPLFTYILTYDVQVYILGENFKELDEMWTGKRNVSLAYRHAFLLNMCKKRQDMNKFVGHSNFTYIF